MKKYTLYIIAALASVLCLASCEKDELSPESVIVVQTTEPTQFDKWLTAHFLKPYNIDFKYRYEIKESDLSFYTVPPKYEEAVMMAHLVEHLCVKTYNEVAGSDFTKGNFPKMFFLIGTWEYLNNGTYILGTAEGGKKIMLSGVNELKEHVDNPEDLNYYYIKTIHHEFTHILNQTTPYQTDFQLVTGNAYVADSWSSAPYNVEFLQNGFISAYAQQSDTEDFAEMMSMYVTHDAAWWKEQLTQAGAGAKLIESKLSYVRTYMQETWNIDLDQLRSVILRRQQEIADKKVDLTDILNLEIDEI